MLKPLSLTSLALLFGLTVAGVGHAADPPGSAPSAPPDPRTPSAVPGPTPLPGPTNLTIDRHVPPPPPGSLGANPDEDVDDGVGLFLILQESPTSQGITAKEDCTFTNDFIAVCKIQVCLSDGFCFDTGDNKCYDSSGYVIPCP